MKLKQVSIVAFNLVYKDMKKLFLISFIFISLFSFVPYASAAGAVTTEGVCQSQSMDDVSGIVNWASCFLMKIIVPFLFALATAAFIWGVVHYYLNPSNEKEREKGKEFVIGGLIALFMMVAMWGIVKVFTNTFDIKNAVPQFPE